MALVDKTAATWPQRSGLNSEYGSKHTAALNALRVFSRAFNLTQGFNSFGLQANPLANFVGAVTGLRLQSFI